MKKSNNLYRLLYVCVFLCTFFGCKKDDIEYSIADITYHFCGSEDLLSTYDITLTYSTTTGIVQETVQLPWEKTIENVKLPFTNTIKIECTRKQNYPQKDFYDIVIDRYSFVKTKAGLRTVEDEDNHIPSHNIFEYYPPYYFNEEVIFEVSPLRITR